jgi:hypothetical protein
MLSRKIATVLAPLMRTVPQKIWPAVRFKENQKLAHLFMICSNLKLTAVEESIELPARRFMNGIKGI